MSSLTKPSSHMDPSLLMTASYQFLEDNLDHSPLFTQYFTTPPTSTVNHTTNDQNTTSNSPPSPVHSHTSPYNSTSHSPFSSQTKNQNTSPSQSHPNSNTTSQNATQNPPPTHLMCTRSKSGIYKPIDRLNLNNTSISPVPRSYL